jgi:hypothetical protein
VALPEEHRPPTPPERIRQEYALRRRRQAASGVPVVVLAIAVGLGSGGGVPLLVVGTVILAFFGFSLVNWRCPSCGAYLGQRLNPERCPACRVELRD